MKTLCPEPVRRSMTGAFAPFLEVTQPPVPPTRVIPKAASIRARPLKQLSHHLPRMASPEDMHSLKVLLQATVQANKAFTPVHYDRLLQEEVFSLLFGGLWSEELTAKLRKVEQGESLLEEISP